VSQKGTKPKVWRLSYLDRNSIVGQSGDGVMDGWMTQQQGVTEDRGPRMSERWSLHGEAGQEESSRLSASRGQMAKGEYQIGQRRLDVRVAMRVRPGCIR
jgi:hypothetical protein